MKIIAAFFFSLLFVNQSNYNTRQLEYNGSKIKTTFEIDEVFYGKYKGQKQGFLQLNRDGSGVYNYDYPGLSKECKGDIIEFDWGFIVDDLGEIVKFERPYGFSYPIIYNCSGDNAFQGCTKKTMVDYILVYKDGTITISSSDDWEKFN